MNNVSNSYGILKNYLLSYLITQKTINNLSRVINNAYQKSFMSWLMNIESINFRIESKKIPIKTFANLYCI